VQKKAAPTAKQAPARTNTPIARTSTNPKGPERSLLELPVSDTAQHGVVGTAVPLPFMDAIQKSFGPYHDLSTVSAHLDARAAGASRALGARAYAFGDHVAFEKPPTLELAAHEAAHVVQQRGRRSGDDEQIASRVAERVVAGRSAMNLLALPVSHRARDRIVQRDAANDAKDLRDDLVRDATSKLDGLRKQAAFFSDISEALRLILLLSRDNGTCQRV
jgi:hypothetical protein